MGPRWAQEGPRQAQEGPRWPQDGPKMAPRWAQDGLKIALRRPSHIKPEKERVGQTGPGFGTCFWALLGALYGLIWLSYAILEAYRRHLKTKSAKAKKRRTPLAKCLFLGSLGGPLEAKLGHKALKLASRTRLKTS